MAKKTRGPVNKPAFTVPKVEIMAVTAMKTAPTGPMSICMVSEATRSLSATPGLESTSR